MNSWEIFDENTLPPKETFYSNLNLEDISNEDYKHAQKVWGLFEIKNLGEYHDVYVQSDTLLLSDVFENFRNMCLNKYKRDPVKLEVLTDYDMILMIEKGIRGRICQITYRYAKANKK